MGSRLIKVQEKGQKRKDIRQEAAGRLQLAEDKKRWRAFGQLSACPVEYEVHSTGVVRGPSQKKNKAEGRREMTRRYSADRLQLAAGRKQLGTEGRTGDGGRRRNGRIAAGKPLPQNSRLFTAYRLLLTTDSHIKGTSLIARLIAIC